MTQARLLRSVSLRDDLAVAARLAHYRPTRRSLPVTRAVLGGDATMVVAAYGSGKSLAAGIGALCIANDSDTYKTLNPVLARLRKGRPKHPCTGGGAPEIRTQGASRSAHWPHPGCGGGGCRRQQE